MDAPNLHSIRSILRTNPEWLKWEEQIVPLAFPAIAAHLRHVEDVPLGASRMGGPADLPAGESWPEGPTGPMTPIAMLRLSEIHAAAPWSPLPKHGLLYLWFDARWDHWGGEPDDVRGFRARFFPDESIVLSRRDPPPRPALTREKAEALGCANPFFVHEIPCILGSHLPNFTSCWSFWQEATVVDSKLDMILSELTHDHSIFSPRGRGDQILGLPDCFQSLFDLVPPGQEEATMEEHAAERAKRPMDPSIVSKAREWLLLADIAWESKTGWLELGDAGQMLWSIHKDDLARGDFSRVWLSIQCG